MSEAYFADEKYIVLGIKLEDTESVYSVLYGDKEEFKEIRTEVSVNSFWIIPELIKLDSGILLMEPASEWTADEEIKELNFYKLENGAFQKIDYPIPDDFQKFDCHTERSGNQFISFWENPKEKQAYFMAMDLDGIKKRIPFPQKYRMLDYTFSGQVLIASVQTENNEVGRILVFNMQDGTFYSAPFGYLRQLHGLPVENDRVRFMATTLDQVIYLLEFKNGELYYEKINVPLENKSIKIFSTENCVILHDYIEERFIKVNIR